jgi:hypothetical protein
MALCALQRAGFEMRDLIEAAASAATGARVAPGRPIGLCTGDAGIACFLAHASDVLGNPRLVDDAMSLLVKSALDTDRMDLADGVAGVLQVASAIYRWTGDAALGSLAETCVERLLFARTETPFGLGWVLPASRTPDGREKVYPGYATGSTGIAVTLLAAGVWFERDEWRDAGAAVLDDLLAHAGSADTPVWPASNHISKPSAFWEKGIAGIGSGFARAALLTGSRRYRDTATGCARWLTPVNPGSLVTLFHGLAGIGELLLDLELFFADQSSRDELDQIVDLVLDQSIDHRGRGWGICFPDEDGLAAADLGLGSAGIAAWLIRYRDGGPRVLFADEGMDLGRFGIDNAQ